MNDLNELHKLLQKKGSAQVLNKPIFFSLEKGEGITALNELLASGNVMHVVDDYKEQLSELYAINNPSTVYTPTFKVELAEHLKATGEDNGWIEKGKWVFLPWRSTLCHVLDEKDFFNVRTARNRLLITTEEQERYADATIGIAGLSVGSNIALALTLQGGPRHIKLADMDRLALTNTNRVLAGIENLGTLKVEMVARKLYEIDPYLNIELFIEGLNEDNIAKYFEGLDLVVDELDNLAIKYLIRVNAQQNKIPVVMGADNGDNAVIDIERYDLDSETKFFHGRLGEVSYESLASLDKFGIGKTITKHIGPENITPRMQQSLLEMGKTIVSWPQLGGAALLNGVGLALCIRKILNKQEVPAERVLLTLDKAFDPAYDSPEEVKLRSDASDTFKKLFGL